MRALIVEDEEKILNILARGLQAEGFVIDSAFDGVSGIELATTYSYDIILLDIQLPKIDGTQVLKRIRQNNCDVPILMLTARDSVQDKVMNFEMGADDYLTKPFSFAELLVRVKALMRRGGQPRTDVINIDELEINRISHQVKRAGKRIELSLKEYSLLEYLVVNSGKVLSRSMIIEHVWDQSFEGLTNIVDVYIRQLRSKIDDPYDSKLIKTVRGVGYMISSQDNNEL